MEIQITISDIQVKEIVEQTVKDVIKEKVQHELGGRDTYRLYWQLVCDRQIHDKLIQKVFEDVSELYKNTTIPDRKAIVEKLTKELMTDEEIRNGIMEKVAGKLYGYKLKKELEVYLKEGE